MSQLLPYQCFIDASHCFFVKKRYSVLILIVGLCFLKEPFVLESAAESKELSKPPQSATQKADTTTQPSSFSIYQKEPDSEVLSTEHAATKGLQALDRLLKEQPLSASVQKTDSFPIDLPTALVLTEKQNLVVQASLINQHQAKNTFHQSLSDMLPDVIGSYDHSRFQGAIQVFGNQTVNVFQTRIVPQLTASWKINPGGKDVFEALAARQRIKKAEFSRQETLQSQLAGVANEYYTFLERSLEVENARLAVEEATQQVALNTAKMKAGVGVKVDLMRAKADLLEQEQSYFRASTRQIESEQALLTRLNLDSETRLAPTKSATQPQILVPLNITRKQLNDVATRNNPQIKKLDKELAALRHESRAILSRLVPSVQLQTYINGTGPAYDQLGLGRFGGVRVETRLFEKLGTKIPLEYHEKSLQLDQKAIEREQAIQQVRANVINQYQQTLLAAKTIFKSQETLAVNQEVYRLAYGRYRAGVGIQLDVLNSHVDLVQARANVINAILSFNQSQVALLNILGLVSANTIINGVNSDVF